MVYRRPEDEEERVWNIPNSPIKLNEYVEPTPAIIQSPSNTVRETGLSKVLAKPLGCKNRYKDIITHPDVDWNKSQSHEIIYILSRLHCREM